MSEKRIKINSIVKNQVPQYVREDYPLVTEFLKQYYIAQEYQGAPLDLLQNIDKYVKIDETTNLSTSVGLSTVLNSFENVISIDLSKNPTGTDGFPDSYGLLKINNEIITYTGKTKSTFTGCVRGFSGITSYSSPSNPEQLVFDTSVGTAHTYGSRVENLSNLFLKEFLSKTKSQIIPGLENRTFNENLNENVFLKNSKDFYLSKGTDRSYEILFKALYSENVKIVRPGEFLFTPSNAQYNVTNDLVVEPVNGDPTNLELMTLFQDAYDDQEKAYAPISNVETIITGTGQTFYRLSVDAGSNKDISVDGSIYGAFGVQPKTRLIGNAGIGISVLDVDSTVGFATNGTLFVTFNDTSTGIVSYTSKSNNQFFGVSGINKTILDTAIVGVNTFAYGRSKNNFDETIEVRINNVIVDCEHPTTFNHGLNDTIQIKTLGVGNTTFKYRNWYYNTAPTYNVSAINLIDASDNTYAIYFDKNHYFKVGDRLTLNSNVSGDKPLSTVTKIVTERTILIKGQGQINLLESFIAKRSLLKAESNNFPAAAVYTSNVQNLYKKKYEDDIIVASSSIPFYNANSLNVTSRSVEFSGTFFGSEFEIILTGDHGFYTGDALYYTPEKVTKTSVNRQTGISTSKTILGTNLFDGDDGGEGLYFVERVSPRKIKLAKSRTELYNKNYIIINSSTPVTNNKFDLYDFRKKTLETQKLYRKLLPPVEADNINVTNPGFTGILVNGVEILNYKSKDVVKYGEIKKIDVLSAGDGYDVINPPVLKINDSVGTGATGTVSVSGSLEEIRLVDPGFDYQEIPRISITGGNGAGAQVSVSLKSVEHKLSFKSGSAGGNVVLGTTGPLSSTIGFGTFHKFKTGEKVFYISEDQTVVGGLTTNTSYFASQVGLSTVRLHPTQGDAVSGINTIVLTSFGSGIHFIKAIKDKKIIESIAVLSGGEGYKNNKRTITPAGINTSSNIINVVNHNYEDGDIVNYTCNGTAPTGLTTNTEYYIAKIDDNNFKLSEVGVTTEKNSFFKTKRYVNLSTVGVGTHFFNYPNIEVSMIGRVGVASTGNINFEAKVQPIFRGQITSVDLIENGVGYGASEIINFERLPNVVTGVGSDAQLRPIIKNGAIEEIVVENNGTGYISTPDIIINGIGIGAVVTPILKTVGSGSTETKSIDYIKVISGGNNYTQNTTTATIVQPGSGAQFFPLIQEWRINLVNRFFETEKVTSDDGFITNGTSNAYGLQYAHLYAPRPLRESVHPNDQSGNVIYRKNDIVKVNGIEVESTNHSPIIGWAYDGNPIYGPYGFSGKNGGVVAQIKSGYSEDSLSKFQRPPISVFPGGYFVEDYTYKKIVDESVLDKNNGRFCVTPEYPNGTYAYFATIDDSLAQGQGSVFSGYKLPVFPYLLGEAYHSKPEPFNFNTESNQDAFKIEEFDYCRSTDPYNLIDGNVSYSYITTPNNLKQKVEVTAVTPGKVEKIGIETGGTGYKVGDKVIFNNTNTKSFSSAIAKVATLKGKQVENISVATSSITNVEIYPASKDNYFVIADNPHNFKKFDRVVITGLSTTSSKIGGFYSAGISSNRLSLVGIGTSSSGVGTVAATGIVTYFKVNGNLNYPQIRENDILGIGTEQVKVLNVDILNSRIRVLRGINGVVGASHTITSVLLEDPRKLTISAGFNTTYASRLNKVIYFDPSDSVGLGTAVGVGIGSTIVFSNPGAGLTRVDIPTKGIYIKDHGLQTGDQLTYSPGNGNGIDVLNIVGASSTLTNNQTLFAAKISNDVIGVATVKVGLGTTGSFVGIASTQRNISTLFFTGFGTGVYHNFKTNFSVITAKLERNTVTVQTKQAHGIQGRHEVDINVSPSISTTVTVKYNDFNRRVIINPKDFAAIGINTSTNTISINNHGFETGEKIIHTALIPAGGLSNNKIYHIVKIDENSFKLSNTEYESKLEKPQTVGITSASSGTINLINPKIDVYKDSTVKFDLSDSSLSYTSQGLKYPAFELNLYLDSDHNNIWNTSFENKTFEVSRTGRAGIDNNASVSLSVNSFIPEQLYYSLDVVEENDVPVPKSDIFIDNTVKSNNQIEVRESLFNGRFAVSIGATNSFNYFVNKLPEKVSYAGTTSKLNYTTDCTHTDGAINSFTVIDGGRNYNSLPGISTIVGVGTTDTGSGAIISVESESIGKIKKTNLLDIGFDFPSDLTLKPSTSIPQIVVIESLSSLATVGIVSAGRGYTVAPKPVVIDAVTKKHVKEIDLVYNLGDTNVRILNNAKGINNVIPTILPSQNSNGIGIGTVGFNTVTKNVTVGLNTGFSSGQTFPLSVGDKVLIEGVSIGIGSTGLGYNSEGYDYKLFEITEVDENLGGIGNVTYSMVGDLPSGVLTPGLYDLPNSAGARIIPERFFPTYNSTIKQNQFFNGEFVKSKSAEGIVNFYDEKTSTLRIESKETFIENEIIRGSASRTEGIVKSVRSYESYLKMGVISKTLRGHQDDSGFLNTNTQRIQDSDYYQTFAYSLNSRVPYDTWNDVVSSTNHVLGYKKFADYQIESVSSVNIGISTDQTSIDQIIEAVGFGDLNCVYDFDLVSENFLNVASRVLSTEIRFSSRILQDFLESVGNRVLLIDDVSSLFNSDPRPTAFSIANTFALSSRRAMKYITYVRDTRFTAQRQLMIVDLIHDGSRGYINQYGRVESTYDQGSFDFNISGSDGQLQFFPTKFKVNDYQIAAISYNLDDNLLSTGATAVGPSIIETDSVPIGTGIGATTIVSIASTHNSVKVLLEITPDISRAEFEYNNLNIVHNGTDIEILEYGQLTTSVGDNADVGFGTYSALINGSNLEVIFHPNSDVGIGTTGVVNTIQVGLATAGITGIGTFDMKHARIEARTTTISSSGTPGIHTISSYPDDYDVAYFVAQVADTTNNQYQMTEIIVVDDFVSGGSSLETYDTEFGEVGTSVGLGTFGTRVSASGTTELMFTPTASINTVVNVYMNALRHQDDDKDTIDFDNAVIESGFATYEGTERDIKRAFELKHETDKIFERSFEGNDSSIVNLTNNTITLPNHFFVSGEKIEYKHAGAGSTQAISIASTTFAGIGSTTLLPSEVFAVKVTDDKIKIASSAENALKPIPESVDLTSVGIGTSHRFVATNQNAKGIIAIDNIIQSPIVSTAVTTTLSNTLFTTDDTLKLVGISSIKGGELIKINNEIIRVDAVNIIGNENSLSVRRGWLGTGVGFAATGNLVTKIVGNYNIIDNVLHFVDAPFGNKPKGGDTNPPDERDFTGITTSSSFQGRIFLRSGATNSTNDAYHENYIFDDLSQEFNGSKKEFTLKMDGSNVTGIATENAIILVNDTFQTPGGITGVIPPELQTRQYTLAENAGITSISFVGAAVSNSADVRTSTVPVGGVIVSVASSEGFGYQPLVAAGGTAKVSVAGTIQSISIGNSGSGYRAGIQTVNVAIRTSSVSRTNIVSIGTAVISNGNITSVSISTDRVFYAPRDVSNVLYDNSSGLTTVTTSTNHGLSHNDQITLSGIAFTCNYSGSGPVNVSNAVYNNVTGIMTVTTSAPHNLSTTGQKSDVILTGLAFTCGLDSGSSTHVYPRTTDPAYCGSKVTAVNSATEFVINVGVSTVPTFYSSSGVAQPALIAPRNVNNSASGTDPAAGETNVLKIINNTSFEVNTGISTRKHFYARCGKVNIPLDVVFDDPLSYSNIPLIYSSTSVGLGTGAKIDVVVGQGSSVIDFKISNTGFSYGNNQTLTVAIGGTIGIPTDTTKTFKEFKIDIDEIASDEFSGWSLGVLQVIDNVEKFIDGTRTNFPIEVDGVVTSIAAARGSKINIQDVLIIFVNNILQVPGKGYIFEGGSQIEFTEAPKIGDTIEIIFYKGTGDKDVVLREIIETVTEGDTLQIQNNDIFTNEDKRSVNFVSGTDIAETNPYSGPGNIQDTSLLRPVVWCRQTEDKIINEKEVGKDRELYEPVINPTAHIIKTVGVGATQIFVDTLRPLFNIFNEVATLPKVNTLSFQDKVKFIPQDDKVSAAGTAIVSIAGTISSVAISNGGVGYSNALVSFGSTNGVGIGTTTTALGTVTIGTAGTITGVAITNPGLGYTQTSPPLVLFSPPTRGVEENFVNSFNGDNGVIVGFGTTSVGIGTTQFIFDLHIPLDSFLRNVGYNTSIVSTAVTASSLSSGDYFMIFNSNVGSAVTSITSLDTSGNIVGVGTSNIDNIYFVQSTETVFRPTGVNSEGVGIGTSHITRVFVNVSNNFPYGSGIQTSNSFGEFSWGRIDLTSRSKVTSYTAFTLGGIGGISTSTFVQRSKSLKSKDYDI